MNRLQSELMTLMMSPTPGISAFPNDSDLLNWTATIEGPADTPYAGLSLKLSFSFPQTYPYTAPTVLFKTPIYHPNIDFSGRICLDILKEKWSAIYNVQTVLVSLQSLLGEPNKYVATVIHLIFLMWLTVTTCSASPLNGQAADLWDKDPAEYKRHVLARHRDLTDEELKEQM
jgi:ubiquitin-conjugating enzyme E2 C